MSPGILPGISPGISSEKSSRLSRALASLSAIVMVLVVAAPVAFAARATNDLDDDSTDIGYDTIVRDLNREADRPALIAKAQKPSYDPFSTVLFHGGVGASILAETVSVGGKDLFINQRGLQVAFGIDLFSPNWLAEGTYRNFGDSETQSVTTSLQEFEMKVFYKERLVSNVGLRAGAGLSARYLSVRGSGVEPITFTTPSGVGTFGIDFFITDKVSLGTDLSVRSAMIADTPDKNSLDFTVRVDAHF